MPEDLPLEPDLIKVLASDTRREILGRLQDRRMTVTELSRELDLRKATVHEHLKKLVEAELVDRREDERLWVYYDLTPRGKRILNPNRTRFYLVVGLGVLAALVGAVLLAVYLQSAPGPAAGPSQPEDVSVQLADERVFSAGPVRLDAVVNGSGTEDGRVSAYLVSAEDAERLRSGDLSAQGIPLEVRTTTRTTATEAGAAAEDADQAGGTRSATTQQTELSTDANVPEGTYYVFVRTGAGTDNRESMPALRVAGLDARLSTSTWTTGLSEGPLEVTVRQEARPLDGLLLVDPADGTGSSLTVRLTQGQATLEPRRLDQLSPGEHRVSVLPDGEEGLVPVEILTVREPTVTVTPRLVPAGTSTDLAIHATADGQPVELAAVNVSGAELLDRRVQPDLTHVSLAAPEAGTVTVHTARTPDHTVQVLDRVLTHLVVEEGPRYTLRVTHPNGTPAEDTAVRLDGRGVGFTNASGQIRLDALPEGRHRLTLQLPTGASLDRVLRVDGWNVSAADPTIDVQARQTTPTPGEVAVEVSVTNRGPVPARATLTALLDGRPIHASGLGLDPNTTERVHVPIPTEVPGEHRVTLELDRFETVAFSFANETTRSTNATAEGDSGADGADATDAAASSPGEDRLVEELSVQVEGVREAMEGRDAAQAAQPGPFEPVYGDQLSDRMDASGQQATPGPGPVLVLVSLAGLALARRRWA